MARYTIQSIIGLAGVSENENVKARQIGHKFEIPMLLIAIWIVVEWYAELEGTVPLAYAYYTDLFVWLFFIAETATLTFLVDNKWYYLRTNWINLVIIFMGLPIIWGVTTYAGILRSLRLLLLAAILVNLSDTIRQILSRNHLGITLFIALIIITLSGILIAGIDPNISSVWDGLWWAWVTVTTVGYGDIVPVSTLGKLFGALLILFGLGLFSLLTANFSAFFISKEEKKAKEIEKETVQKLDIIEKRIAALEKTINKFIEK